MRILIALILSVLTLSACAHGGDREAIMHIIKEVKRGWETGDGAPFREHFLDFEGARYIESGGQNIGLDDLVIHHVEPEKDAIIDLALNYSNIEIHRTGNFAWAVADTQVRGTVRKTGITLRKKGFQTFILEKREGVWKVLHTHSSSRNDKPERAEQHSH